MNITIQLNKRIKGFKEYYDLYVDSDKVGDVYLMGKDWSFTFWSRFSGFKGKKFIPREVLTINVGRDRFTVDGHVITRHVEEVFCEYEDQLPEKLSGSLHGFDFETKEEAFEFAKKVIESGYFEKVPAQV